MADLLTRALAPESVNRAWKRLRNDRAPWLPDIERDAFLNNHTGYLMELVDELRNGAYRPRGLRQFPTHKADGRIRILSALTLLRVPTQSDVLIS